MKVLIKKFGIDEEYFIENKLERNTDLINKAYNKILNDDKINNNNNKDENELKQININLVELLHKIKIKKMKKFLCCL